MGGKSDDVEGRGDCDVEGGDDDLILQMVVTLGVMAANIRVAKMVRIACWRAVIDTMTTKLTSVLMFRAARLEMGVRVLVVMMELAAMM